MLCCCCCSCCCCCRRHHRPHRLKRWSLPRRQRRARPLQRCCCRELHWCALDAWLGSQAGVACKGRRCRCCAARRPAGHVAAISAIATRRCRTVEHPSCRCHALLTAQLQRGAHGPPCARADQMPQVGLRLAPSNQAAEKSGHLCMGQGEKGCDGAAAGICAAGDGQPALVPEQSAALASLLPCYLEHPGSGSRAATAERLCWP